MTRTYSVNDFKPGDNVRSTGRKGCLNFFGQVIGLSCNSQGEPLLKLHMFTRSSGDPRACAELGWTKVNTHSSIYEKVSSTHPSNVRPMEDNFCLGEE